MYFTFDRIQTTTRYQIPISHRALVTHQLQQQAKPQQQPQQQLQQQQQQQHTIHQTNLITRDATCK